MGGGKGIGKPTLATFTTRNFRGFVAAAKGAKLPAAGATERRQQNPETLKIQGETHT